jgi:transposase InsO family protein
MIIEEQTQSLLDRNLIEESESQVSSRVRLADKPDGTQRMCVNYYRLNKLLMDVKLNIPTIRDGIDKLKRARYFTSLDLKSGFWQLPIAEADRWITAFNAGNKLYQWKVLPMGLKTAPGLFQKAMDRMLSSKYDDKVMVQKFGNASKYAFCYIDDILIFSEKEEDHIEHVRDVLRRVREFGLRLKPEKCKFFQTRIKYLGYIVKGGRVSINREKANTVRNYPRPETKAALHSFVALCQHYQDFIQGFADIARPLWDMVRSGDMNWTKEASKAFNRLKREVSADPEEGGSVLILPDMEAAMNGTKKFRLYTDASAYAMGGVLSQEGSDGKMHPIMFISKKFKDAETRYPTRDREALAIVWAVRRLHKYLHGTEFIVKSDHANLKWLMEGDTRGRLANWVTILSNYDFTIEHIKGIDNVSADSLSRIKYGSCAAITAMMEYPLDLEAITFPELVAPGHCSLIRRNGTERCMRIYKHEDMSWTQLEREAQDNEEDSRVRLLADLMDSERGRVFSAREDLKVEVDGNKYDVCAEKTFVQQTAVDPQYKNLVAHFKGETPENKGIRKMKETMSFKGGLLYYTDPRLKNKEGAERLFVPTSLRHSMLVMTHRLPMAGHTGTHKMLATMKRKFWWPGMVKEVTGYVKGCAECKMSKTPTQSNKGFVQQYPFTDTPFEYIHVDHVGPLPVTQGGNEYILMVVDRASGYVIAIPVANVTAVTTAKALWDFVFCKHGIPRRIISDRGPAFKNGLVELLAKKAGFFWNYTSAYNPRSNGKVERVNRTLKATLRSFCKQDQLSWDQYVPSFAFACNNSPTFSMNSGITPHEFIFGQILAAPEDRVAEDPDKWMEKDEAMAARFKVRQEAQLKLAEAHLKKQLKDMQEEGTSKEKLRHVEYKVGDIVLLYSPSVPVGVSAKLFPSWRGPYFIVRRTGAYNYDIANKKKEHSSVHVRRLVKYDPYLLEHESVLDALKRVQEDFWVQRKPQVAMDSGEEKLVEYKSNESKKEERKKTRPASGVRKRDSEEHADRRELLVSGKDIPDTLSRRSSPRLRRSGNEKRGTHKGNVQGNPSFKPKVGDFYLMRLDHPHFGDEEGKKTFWLMEIIEASHEGVVGHLWRSRYDVEDDERYVPYSYKVDKPRQLINYPFKLDEESRIPPSVWDLVEELGLDHHIIGGSPPSKYVRAKK